MNARNEPYHHGDLTKALVDAAEKLLEKKGVAGVSLRETAKLTGVSHAAPYRHFKDKTALLASLSSRGYRRLADAMEKCLSDHPDSPLDQLSTSSHAYVQLATRHPQMTSLMFGGVLQQQDCSEELILESERAFTGLLKIIRNGQDAGLLIEKETEQLALLTWSTVHGFSMLCSAGHLQHTARSEEQIHQLVDILGQMLLSGIAKN